MPKLLLDFSQMVSSDSLLEGHESPVLNLASKPTGLAWTLRVSRPTVMSRVRHSGTLRTGTSSCACTARYHTNAIAVSDFIITTRKWAKLYKLRVGWSVTRSENVILYLAEGELRPACTLPLEVSWWESSTNCFKLLPISCSCADNFHMRDNHMHVVWSHVLAT